jgi:hypothetical protein
MTRVAFLLMICVVVTATALLPGRADDKLVDGKYTYVHGASFRGLGDTSYGLASGVLVCEKIPLRPIAWFGAVKPDAGKSQFLYLMIFKTPAGFNGARDFHVSWNGRSSSQDGVAGTLAVEMIGKKFEVTYEFPVDPKTHAVLKQSLVIGGREVKEGDPRVYVVDLTGERVTYTPVKVSLPKDAPDVSQEKDDEWGEAVQRAVDQMKKDSSELRSLLDAAK